MALIFYQSFLINHSPFKGIDRTLSILTSASVITPNPRKLWRPNIANDLAESSHDRQNILNHRYTLQQAEPHLERGRCAFSWRNSLYQSTANSAAGVSEPTIKSYLSSHGGELGGNGHRLLKVKKLKQLK